MNHSSARVLLLGVDHVPRIKSTYRNRRTKTVILTQNTQLCKAHYLIIAVPFKTVDVHFLSQRAELTFLKTATIWIIPGMIYKLSENEGGCADARCD